MKAEIIAVGTELLLGNIVNTNAQFLSQQLSLLGIDVYYQQVVGDNPRRLKEVICQAIDRSDVVLLSGGLGPTEDDLTKETAAECLGLPLYFDESVMEEMTRYLKGNVPSANKKQAYIPQNAMILHNSRGTAPGVIMEQEGKIVVLLPGPPRELEPMFSEQVAPYLRKRSDFVMKSKVLRLFGIGEASAAEAVKDLMDSANPTLAPYAKEGEMIFRITAKSDGEEEAEALISEMEAKVSERLGQYIYACDEEEMKQVLCRMLAERKHTVAAAESCTAGMFTAMLADVPGASDVLKESVVTYSNEAKEKYLGVSHETLEAFGAVSEQTAREMAEGVRRTSGADIGVGITGIAGPGGGTAEKSVGLVYVAVASETQTVVRKLCLHGTRQRVRYASCLHALNEVRKILKNPLDE